MSEVENWSVTFVEKCVNFGGEDMFLCVSTANLGQDVCVCVCVCVGGGTCQVGFGIWVASQMPNQLDK